MSTTHELMPFIKVLKELETVLNGIDLTLKKPAEHAEDSKPEPKPEPPKPTYTPEPSKPEPSKPEPPRLEPSRLEPSRPEPTKGGNWRKLLRPHKSGNWRQLLRRSDESLSVCESDEMESVYSYAIAYGFANDWDRGKNPASRYLYGKITSLEMNTEMNAIVLRRQHGEKPRTVKDILDFAASMQKARLFDAGTSCILDPSLLPENEQDKTYHVTDAKALKSKKIIVLLVSEARPKDEKKEENLAESIMGNCFSRMFSEDFWI